MHKANPNLYLDLSRDPAFLAHYIPPHFPPFEVLWYLNCQHLRNISTISKANVDMYKDIR